MGYTSNAVRGFGWQTVLKGMSLGLTFVKIAVLARLLSPDDFGLFALIAISLGLAEASTQTGINVTILQSKQSIQYFLNTAWVISIVRGLLIAVVMSVAGLGLAAYYNEPSLTYLVALTSLVPVIKGFINPSIVLFHKNLEFLKDAAYRFSLVLVETIAAVILAVLLKSVLALIVALLIGALFEVILTFVLFPLKPRFAFVSSRAKTIFANAKGLSISAAFAYLNDNADDFIIGKTLGTQGLGFYHNAYALTHKPNYEISRAANHSTLPVYTKIASDKKRLRRAFQKTAFSISGIIFLLSLPLLIAPAQIVSLVLGNDWLSIVPALPWLVGAGLLHSISNLSYNVFLATRQYTVMNIHLAVSLIIMAVLLLMLSPEFGLTGAAAAMCIARFLPLGIIIYGLKKAFTD